MAVTDMEQVVYALGGLFLVSSICLYFFSASPGVKWEKVLDQLSKLALEHTSLLLGVSALALGVKGYSPWGAMALYIIMLAILGWDIRNTQSRRAA